MASSNKQSLLQDAARLVSANGVIQVIAVLLLPLLGRLYTPMDMGVVGLIMSICGIAGVASCGRYDMALMVAPRGGRQPLLYALGCLICIGVSLLMLLVSPLVYLILPQTNYASLQPYLLMIPLLIFLGGMFSMQTAYLSATKSYGWVSWGQLCWGSTNNLLKVSLGYWGWHVWGIVMAYTIAVSSSLTLYGWSGALPRLRGIRISRLRLVAYVYRRFPRYTIYSAGIETMLGSLPALLLPLNYPMEAVGLVVMAQMLSRRPIQVFADALSRVYCRRFVELRTEGRSFLPEMRRFSLGLALVLVVGFALLSYTLEPIVLFLLEEKWLAVVPIIIATLPYLASFAFSSIFNFVPDVLGRQRQMLFLQAGRLILDLVLLVVVARYCPFASFVWIFFGVSATTLGGLMLWYYTLVARAERGYRTNTDIV